MNRITLQNKYTKDIATFEYEKTSNSQANGLMLNEAIKKSAYKLGCEKEDLNLLHPSNKK